MRMRIESKKIMEIMHGIPEPSLMENTEHVQNSFQKSIIQGEDQAKAAIKGNLTLSEKIPYLLFIGPYFVSVDFGPFTQGQLGVRTLKPSPTDDFEEAVEAKARLDKALSRPATVHKVYLLGTQDATEEIERVLSSTDGLAQPLRDKAIKYRRKLSWLLSSPPTLAFNHRCAEKRSWGTTNGLWVRFIPGDGAGDGDGFDPGVFDRNWTQKDIGRHGARTSIAGAVQVHAFGRDNDRRPRY